MSRFKQYMEIIQEFKEIAGVTPYMLYQEIFEKYVDENSKQFKFYIGNQTTIKFFEIMFKTLEQAKIINKQGHLLINDEKELIIKVKSANILESTMKKVEVDTSESMKKFLDTIKNSKSYKIEDHFNNFIYKLSKIKISKEEVVSELSRTNDGEKLMNMAERLIQEYPNQRIINFITGLKIKGKESLLSKIEKFIPKSEENIFRDMFTKANDDTIEKSEAFNNLKYGAALLYDKYDSEEDKEGMKRVITGFFNSRNDLEENLRLAKIKLTKK